ncbi:MAG: hypothetical protein IJ996_03530 [Clostridia bacterium]|nr:hypothetical protein [Clostridia bacterium]
MENQANKQSEEVLAEVYRNTQLALQSISNLLPQIDDMPTREELLRQHEEYEQISAKTAVIAKDKGIELKDPNPFKKMMMWGSIKMSTLTDNSPSHVAEMMVQGTVMGITALKKSLGELSPDAHEEIRALAEEFLKMEERFEEIWKERL